jgi:hypothetical protein
MSAQVREEVSSCTVCDRVNANFEIKDPALTIAHHGNVLHVGGRSV